MLIDVVLEVVIRRVAKMSVIVVVKEVVIRKVAKVVVLLVVFVVMTRRSWARSHGGVFHRGKSSGREE